MSWKLLVTFTLLPYHRQGKSSWYPLSRRMGEPQTRPRCIGKEKNLLPRWEIKKFLGFSDRGPINIEDFAIPKLINRDVKHILSVLWTLKADYFCVYVYVYVYSWPWHFSQHNLQTPWRWCINTEICRNNSNINFYNNCLCIIWYNKHSTLI